MAVGIGLALGSGCTRITLPGARIVPGKGQEGLTWKRAVQLAVARHPDLLQARAAVKARAHQRNQAFGAYLPSVDGTAQRRRVRDTDSDTTDSVAFDLDVTQPLFTGFGLTGDAIQAVRAYEAAQWAYVEESAEVRQALRTAYVELLRLDQLLEVNLRIAARRNENAELTKLRYEAGREHEGSWRRSQAIAEEAAFEVRQVERRTETQSLILGRQIGGYFAVPMPLAAELESMVPEKAPEQPQDYAQLAEQTPIVQRLTRTAEASKAAILSAQSELWPSVNGAYNHGYSGESASDLDEESTLGVTVSVPLFAGGRNVQGVLESSASYQAALEAARSARDARITELSSRWALYRDAWELVSVRRAFLEAARQRAEIVRAQYTTGLADFQDFDIAEQELADSERAYVQSLADVSTRESDWIAAQGGTLEDIADAE
jgi:outer membrane protein TolC